VVYECAMSHIWMCHVTHMNVPCHTYECAMSHIWMRHVTHMNVPCHTYECAMSHIWMRHVTHMNVPCHTYECAMSHIWMRHVTHMNVPCHTYECAMSHIWMCHVTHMNVPGHTYEWVLLHLVESCPTYFLGWVMSPLISRHRVCVRQTQGGWHINESDDWVMPRMNESCHIQTSHVTCKWFMSHMFDPICTDIELA